ncbi:hypothetical protein LPJ61_006112 [Coemansia biformis]|uniref:BZIP domain-containing protein n=1 Tax=Coemansia biformis TaxID=1286918 RepID=A0A9W8CQS3_9FUNG|nr:hypothetical protein LPJ61_006112 [Coemansia biformis]
MDGIPVAMAGPSVNDAESTSPKELETTLKRRKRNAESAARLRERRKLREADLQDACAKLESQIAELKRELVHEKHRAKESLKGIKAPETSAAEPAGDANIEQVTTSMGDVVVVGAKRRRNPQDSSNGDASSSAYDPEAAGGFDQPKARPLRELDMVRMSDLRSKIETLGELNQNVCVNLGVLRQEIQRLVNAVIAKKTLAPV